MLRSAATPVFGGTRDFEIDHSNETYTFADSDKNIFTGQVEGMASIFRETSFNQDIGYWDTSSVTDMRNMFYKAASFNRYIGSWDISSVQRATSMFEDTDFNQDIGSWDMLAMLKIDGMFQNNASFNHDIGGWDTSNITSMNAPFSNASAFNKDIGGWNTSSVTEMRSVFRDASSFNQDISGWDVSNVEVMNYMFNNASSFNQDLSPWCVSEILSKPLEFDSGASSWSSSKPNWGNCGAPVTYTLTGPSEVEEGPFARALYNVSYTGTLDNSQSSARDYTITGIDQNDIGVSDDLTGTFYLLPDGSSSTVSIFIYSDLQDEGNEVLTLSLNNEDASISTTIIDTDDSNIVE